MISNGKTDLVFCIFAFVHTLHFMYLRKGIAYPCICHILFSPQFALATIVVRGTPVMGHIGFTHLKSPKKESSSKDPLLGWSATFDLEGTLATHSKKLSSFGSSRRNSNRLQSSCRDVPFTRTSKAGQCRRKV